MKKRVKPSRKSTSSSSNLAEPAEAKQNQETSELWHRLSRWARIVVLAAGTKQGMDWLQGEIESRGRKCGLNLRPYVQEACKAGFLESIKDPDGQRTYRQLLQPPNPRNEENRVIVGVAFMADGNWYGEDDFRLKLYFQDGRKVVSQMKKSGYTIKKQWFSQGKGRIVKYRLVDETPASEVKHVTSIPALRKEELYKAYDYECVFCRKAYPVDELFPDHRIPTNIAGDKVDFSNPKWTDDFQPVCREHNYNKREACKRCPNTDLLDPDLCRLCQWYDANNAPVLPIRINRECQYGRVQLKVRLRHNNPTLSLTFRSRRSQMGIQQELEIKRAESLAQRLLRHPHLRSRLEALLDVVENAEGDLLKADQAEERVIEELRQIGQQALQAWAQRKASRLTSESDKRSDLSRKEKKRLLAYQIRKDRSRRADLQIKQRLFTSATIY